MTCTRALFEQLIRMFSERCCALVKGGTVDGGAGFRYNTGDRVAD